MSKPITTCRACGAAIIFGRTNAGKAIPLDAEPSTDGNVILDSDGMAFILGRDAATAEHAKGTELRVAHFVTCPDAARFRKRGHPNDGSVR